MNCSQVQDWLLAAENPSAAIGKAVLAAAGSSREMLEHLAACTDCRQMAEELTQLETDWREMPLPASAATAQTRFLEKLSQQLATPVEVRVRRQPAAWWFRWALAASVMLAISWGVYQIVPSSEAQAAPDVVQRLIDWNLELSGASHDQRKEIFDKHADSLSKELQASKLSDEDAELGRKLLDDANWLVTNRDPAAEASYFNRLADQLFHRVHVAAKAEKYGTKFVRTARHLAQAEDGLRETLTKMELAEDADHRHIEDLSSHQLQRQSATSALVDTLPSSVQRQVKHALDPSFKPHKGAKRNSAKK